MRKINHFILFAGLCLFSLVTMAQDVNYEKQILFNLPTKNVEGICSNKDEIYIRTVDSLYVISKNGKIKSALLAKIFPTLGASAIIYAKKSS